MLHLSSNERYYFYNQITDLRKDCYGLCGIVQNELKKNILSGDVFVFINKRHNQIKLLLLCKRLHNNNNANKKIMQIYSFKIPSYAFQLQ